MNLLPVTYIIYAIYFIVVILSVAASTYPIFIVLALVSIISCYALYHIWALRFINTTADLISRKKQMKVLKRALAINGLSILLAIILSVMYERAQQPILDTLSFVSILIFNISLLYIAYYSNKVLVKNEREHYAHPKVRSVFLSSLAFLCLLIFARWFDRRVTELQNHNTLKE